MPRGDQPKSDLEAGASIPDAAEPLIRPVRRITRAAVPPWAIIMTPPSLHPKHERRSSYLWGVLGGRVATAMGIRAPMKPRGGGA